MKHFFKVSLVGFLFFGVLAFPSIGILNAKEGKNFQSIPAKKLSSKLRGIAYATLRTTLLKKLEFKSPQDYRYLPCPDDFPEIPGDLPCNFLTLPEPIKAESNSPIEPSESTDDGVLTESLEGGIVSASEATSVSPNLGGKIFLLGEGEDAMTLFYSKNGYLSHYRLGNQLVIFIWQNQKGKETLIQILLFKLNSELFPDEGKEVLFSK